MLLKDTEINWLWWPHGVKLERQVYTHAQIMSNVVHCVAPFIKWTPNTVSPLFSSDSLQNIQWLTGSFFFNFKPYFVSTFSSLIWDGVNMSDKGRRDFLNNLGEYFQFLCSLINNRLRPTAIMTDIFTFSLLSCYS